MIDFIIKNKSYILIWLLLTSTAPFIFFSWPGHPYKILAFSCLSIMFIQILYSEKKVIDKAVFCICLLQMAFYSFLILYHEDKSNINLITQIISLIIAIIYINNFIGFKGYVKSYIYIINAMGIGGTIIFFLHIIFGINPLFQVDYSESGTSYFLYLTSTNVYYNLDNGLRLIRYSGFFDEPGAFALFSMFAIILNKIYFNNNKVEISLLITTLFTLSIAFYFFVLFYVLFFYISKRYMVYALIGICILTFISNSLLENKSNDPSINLLTEFTIGRIEKDENSGFSGNNRSEMAAADKKIFIDYPLLGSGSIHAKVNGSNIFSILAKYGLIGFFIFYGFLIYILLLIATQKRKDKILHFKILFLIILNFTHRPELSSVLTILVFISYIYYLKNNIECSSFHNQNT